MNNYDSQKVLETFIAYDAALGELDFETEAGWFAVYSARDELIRALGITPGDDEPPRLADLLAEVVQLREQNGRLLSVLGELGRSVDLRALGLVQEDFSALRMPLRHVFVPRAATGGDTTS